MVAPELFVRSHLPFDPMWQLLVHPVAEGWESGQPECSKGLPFCFSDSILEHRALPYSKMYANEMRRMRLLGMIGDAAKRYYAEVGRLLASSEAQEQKDAYERWLYTIGKEQQRCSDAETMWQQLMQLSVDYEQRGVTIVQLRYSATVLADLVRQCIANITDLGAEKYANSGMVGDLRGKAMDLERKVAELQRQVDAL